MIAIALIMAATATQLRSTAHDYYEWQKREFPVFASDQGFHAHDDRLADFSTSAIARRCAHVRGLLDRVRATDISKWSKDDKIDAILFRAQLEGSNFPDRV